MQQRFKFAFVALALVSAGPAAQAELKYRITNLGTFESGDELLFGNALNNAGTVVGVFGDPDARRSGAFIWEAGRMRALGTYGGWSPYYQAADVNDAGVAVGTIVDRRERSRKPVLYRNGEAINFLGDPSRGTEGEATAINNAGVAVGWSDRRAFVYDGTSVTYIPTGHPTQYVRALDINNHGVVLGSALGGNSYNFLWDGSEVTRLPKLKDNQHFDPVEINDAGAVLGVVSTLRPGQDTLSQAYIYFDGRYQAVGDAGTRLSYLNASALNDNNWVVGTTRLEGNLETTAVLWRNGRTVDLNSLVAGGAGGWNLDHAADINERGQIVGTGIFNGDRRAFLATPVPEPGCWVLMLAGMGVLGWRFRRQRQALPS